MEDAKSARRATVVRIDECCRFEEELWRRSYERLLPPLARRRQAAAVLAQQESCAPAKMLAKGAQSHG
jgi:hypothetical protein